MRFHLCAAFYVYLFSLFYGFGKTEYILITLMVCGVLALELVNSSLERTVERPAPDRYMTAGVVKDMAAGAGIQHRVRGVRRCPVLGCRGVPAHVRFLCGKAAAGGAAGRVSCRGVAVHFWKTEGRQIIAAGTDKIDLRGHRGPPQCGEIVSFEQNGGGKGGHRHRKTPDDTNAHHGYIDARCGAVCISGHAGHPPPTHQAGRAHGKSNGGFRGRGGRGGNAV